MLLSADANSDARAVHSAAGRLKSIAALARNRAEIRASIMTRAAGSIGATDADTAAVAYLAGTSTSDAKPDTVSFFKKILRLKKAYDTSVPSPTNACAAATVAHAEAVAAHADAAAARLESIAAVIGNDDAVVADAAAARLESIAADAAAAAISSGRIAFVDVLDNDGYGKMTEAAVPDGRDAADAVALASTAAKSARAVCAASNAGGDSRSLRHFANAGAVSITGATRAVADGCDVDSVSRAAGDDVEESTLFATFAHSTISSVVTYRDNARRDTIDNAVTSDAATVADTVANNAARAAADVAGLAARIVVDVIDTAIGNAKRDGKSDEDAYFAANDAAARAAADAHCVADAMEYFARAASDARGIADVVAAMAAIAGSVYRKDTSNTYAEGIAVRAAASTAHADAAAARLESMVAADYAACANILYGTDTLVFHSIRFAAAHADAAAARLESEATAAAAAAPGRRPAS